MSQTWPYDNAELFQDTLPGSRASLVRHLFDQIIVLDGCFPVLYYLETNSNTLHTLTDIAYHLHQSRDMVKQNLAHIAAWGLARQVNFAGISFYGITAHFERRLLVQELCVFHYHWQAAQDQVEDTLELPQEADALSLA